MNFRIPETYRQAQEPSKLFYDSTHAGDRLVTLGGPCGVGKTYDACAFLNKCLTLSHRVAYTRASDFQYFDAIDIEELNSVKILVIDDYGKQQTTGTLNRVSDMIDYRMCYTKKYTILVTNLLADIRMLDERLASRLNAGVIINYSGLPDRRLLNKDVAT